MEKSQLDMEAEEYLKNWAHQIWHDLDNKTQTDLINLKNLLDASYLFYKMVKGKKQL